MPSFAPSSSRIGNRPDWYTSACERGEDASDVATMLSTVCEAAGVGQSSSARSRRDSVGSAIRSLRMRDMAMHAFSKMPSSRSTRSRTHGTAKRHLSPLPWVSYSTLASSPAVCSALR